MANYGAFWLAYLTAASVFIALVWRKVVIRPFPLLTYWVRALSVATLMTPWSSNVRDPFLAPALMIMALDGITLGAEAGLRAFVPLFVSWLLALLIATVWWWRGPRGIRKNMMSLK